VALYELRKPKNDGSIWVSSQVRINDSETNSFIKSLWVFGENWKALAVIRVDDLSGNFIPEIAVLAVNRKTGGSRVKIVDPDSRETIANSYFLGSGWHVKDLMQVDTNNDTWPEIGVLAKNKASGKGILRIEDPVSGEFIKNIHLPK